VTECIVLLGGRLLVSRVDPRELGRLMWAQLQGRSDFFSFHSQKFNPRHHKSSLAFFELCLVYLHTSIPLNIHPHINSSCPNQHTNILIRFVSAICSTGLTNRCRDFTSLPQLRQIRRNNHNHHNHHPRCWDQQQPILHLLRIFNNQNLLRNAPLRNLRPTVHILRSIHCSPNPRMSSLMEDFSQRSFLKNPKRHHLGIRRYQMLHLSSNLRKSKIAF
jgi:hypothetical protein